MLKRQTKNQSLFRGPLKRPLLILSAFIIVSGVGVPLVRAATCSTSSDCRAQINNLNNKNSQNKQALGSLELQASSYQDAINRLQSQISGLQSQIAQNEAEQAKLQQQITDDENKIANERQVLGDDLKNMYVDGQMSTIEELATSNNLSEYVDKEEFRILAQNKIQDILTQIKTLQAQLEKQKADVEALLSDEQSQKTQLDSDRSQQAHLLSLNQSQQADYNHQIASNAASISALQAKLAQLNTPKGSRVIVSGTCGGGYPASATGPYGNWGCNYRQDNTIDNWGMYNRECVSYTAWRVHQEFEAGLVSHDMPNWGGTGDAYEWISDARGAGIPVDQDPHVGDIAIRPRSGTSGDVGHAMYVEAVNGDGTIIVSQYNANYNGTYSEVSRSTSGLYFLHFRDWHP